MARKKKTEKAKKTKGISYKFAEAVHDGKPTEPYKLLERVLSKHHKDLVAAEARVLVAWDRGKAQPDVDGFVKTGRVRLGDDLDRNRKENPFDVLLIVRRVVYDSFTEQRKLAELDNLLCRVAPVKDPTGSGENYEDDNGRAVFRKRRPIEVFAENVARYGFHQQPKLAECLALFNDKQRGLLKEGAAGKKRGAKFSEPANPGPANSKGAVNGAQLNGHAAGGLDPWGVSIDVLSLPPGISAHLRDLGIETVRDVADHARQAANKGQALYKGGTGLGADRGELLKAAMDRFKSEHPRKKATATK